MEKRGVVIGTARGTHKCTKRSVLFKYIDFGKEVKKLCTSCENYA